MSEKFCILNTYDIDLYWNKYSRKEFRHENYLFFKNRQINFSDWLILQDGLPENVPENLITATDDSF